MHVSNSGHMAIDLFNIHVVSSVRGSDRSQEIVQFYLDLQDFTITAIHRWRIFSKPERINGNIIFFRFD